MPRLSLALFALLLFSFETLAQTKIKGRVLDKPSSIGVIGASVYLDGVNDGTFTDFEGYFQFTTKASGSIDIIVTYMGYEKSEKTLNLIGEVLDLGDIVISPSAIGLEEANVIASVAIDRSTPVAVSTVDAQLIEEKIGDRELVEVLNFTPGVYATKGGGGFGDSRINIRGFDQRNVAVLVNGVPVNDMENGWVYWSNWAGIGDAVRTMQVQRGLGASKLAISSVGGTINIVTKATDAEKGGSFKSSLTNYGRHKYMLSISTGVMENGWAISAVGSRTNGEGYVDATWVDAWSYFITAAKDYGKHRLVFTAIGAPQQHGQRRGLLSIDRFNGINSLDDSLGFEGHRWNDDWGCLDGEVFNSRVNSYHKPQIALNHYLDLGEKTHLATSAYVSIGKGFGSGYNGSLTPRHIHETADGNVKGLWNWDYIYEANSTNNHAAVYLDDQIVYDTETGTWTDTLHQAGDPFIQGGDTIVGGKSLYQIKKSHNEHLWAGILSTLRADLSPNLNLIAGVDVRHYEGKHFRTLGNMLGGDYYISRFSSPSGYGINPDYNLLAREGDIIDYDNTVYVQYSGLFAQLEYSGDIFSAFIAGSGSLTGYQRHDPYTYFRYEETGLQDVSTVNPETGQVETTEEYVYGEWSQKANAPGFNAKAGGSFALTDNQHIYTNIGYYSRAPFVRNVFPNYQNILSNENLVNEKVEAVELGYRMRQSFISLDVNLYHTRWLDKSIMSGPILRPDGTEYRAFVTGLIETHDGLEIEFRAKPIAKIEFGALMSLGYWRWDNNVNANIINENTGQVEDSLFIYSAGLLVGDAPQAQFGSSLRLDLPKNLRLGMSYVYNTRLYARFDVDQDRDDEERIGVQPVQLPSYGYLDAFLNWNLRMNDLNYTIGVNVQNAMNNIYMNEAIETWITDPTTGEKVQGTVENERLEGYWSFGRTVSISARVAF